jgi:class 3 adenylate cyclase
MAVLAGLALIGALAGLIVIGLRYQAERRESARVRALFSRYVAPPIVEELLRRKDPRLYIGRSLNATIVVCRIWNFAGFAENLTAEQTLRYLNEFFALAGSSIQKHRGMIDKFLPDGIIGIFGVPLDDPDAQEHALRAAIDIVRLVNAMERRWREQGRRSFQVGIGINSGAVIAGDAGFHERREFTAVGPEALFAARLQEATHGLHASIVAAASTCNPVRDLFSLVPLTGHPLPGLKRLADAFIVLGLTKASEPLQMPAPGMFKETAIDGAVVPAARPAPASPAAPPPPIAAPVATPAKQTQRNAPPPPHVPVLPRVEPVEPLGMLPHGGRAAEAVAAETAADAAFALPELGGFPHFDDNDAPIYPEPPVPNNEYEDGGGPPIRLPP